MHDKYSIYIFIFVFLQLLEALIEEYDYKLIFMYCSRMLIKRGGTKQDN